MFKISRVNYFIKLFGLFKIPMIAYVNPKVVEVSHEKVVIKIKKNWRTKNHFNSMYFGAIAIGADLSGGILAFMKAKELKVNPSLVFKNFTANFIKRPDGHVFFECENGLVIDKMLQESSKSKERVTETTTILAYTNYYNSDKELVAEMTLGVSIKVKP